METVISFHYISTSATESTEIQIQHLRNTETAIVFIATVFRRPQMALMIIMGSWAVKTRDSVSELSHLEVVCILSVHNRSLLVQLYSHPPDLHQLQGKWLKAVSDTDSKQ